MELFDLPKDIISLIKNYLESIDMFQMTLVCKKGEKWKCESKIDLLNEVKPEDELIICTAVMKQEGKIKFRIEEKRFYIEGEKIEIRKENEKSLDMITYMEYYILKNRVYVSIGEINAIDLKLLLMESLEYNMKCQSSDEELRWTLNGLSKNTEEEERKKDLIYMIWKELKIPNPARIVLSPIAFSFMRHYNHDDTIGFAANYYITICSVSDMIKNGIIHKSDHTNDNIAVFNIKKEIPKKTKITNNMFFKILGLMIGDKILMRSFLKRLMQQPL